MAHRVVPGTIDTRIGSRFGQWLLNSRESAPAVANGDTGRFCQERGTNNTGPGTDGSSGDAGANIHSSALGDAATAQAADSAARCAPFSGRQRRLPVLPLDQSPFWHPGRPRQKDQRDVPGLPRARFQCTTAHATGDRSFGSWSRELPNLPSAGSGRSAAGARGPRRAEKRFVPEVPRVYVSGSPQLRFRWGREELIGVMEAPAIEVLSGVKVAPKGQIRRWMEGR